MESGSSATGGSGLRVAPAEHSRLPPLVGDDAPLRTPMWALPSIRRHALPTPRSCSRALVYAPALSSPRCAWWVPTCWSPKARVSTRGAWSAIGPSSVRVLSSVVAPWSMRARLSAPGPSSMASCRSRPACISVSVLTSRGRRPCGRSSCGGAAWRDGAFGSFRCCARCCRAAARRAACSSRGCVGGGRACAGSGSGSLSLNVCVLRRADSISSASVASRVAVAPGLRLLRFRSRGW